MAWSNFPHSINKSKDHYVESNYVEQVYKGRPVTWFQKNWWKYNDWGWIYTNDTNMSLRVTDITFLACAGHSNNKGYYGGGSGLLYTYGYGCEFTSDVYVIDSAGSPLGNKSNVGNCKVESITEYNCYYNGYGNTSTTAQDTSFGAVTLFTGLRARHPISIAYTDAPAVPPGGKMFVVIRPTKWYTDSSSALLVMQGDASSFSSVLEPEDDDYIWICLQKEGDAQPKWYKEKKAFIRTQTGWEEMEGE